MGRRLTKEFRFSFSFVCLFRTVHYPHFQASFLLGVGALPEDGNRDILPLNSCLFLKPDFHDFVDLR